MDSSDQKSVSTDIYGGIVGVSSVIFLCQFGVERSGRMSRVDET